MSNFLTLVQLASRKHIEFILPVVKKALKDAHLSLSDIDGIAATNTPGLLGSLLVGFTFAKTLSLASQKPFIAINHMLAHLYASHIAFDIEYPYLGLLVSGGHCIICKVMDFDKTQVLGTTIDDAPGEAFDKVAKFYNFGYPGGVIIDEMSKKGDVKAASFPMPFLHGEGHECDVSYSGLKTAVINQIDKFWHDEYPKTPSNIAASFQYTAIKILLRAIKNALEETKLTTLVAGGGVAANSLLRKKLLELKGITSIFPPLSLCTDNAAMVAGLGYQYLKRGIISDANVEVQSRVMGFSKKGKRAKGNT